MSYNIITLNPYVIGEEAEVIETLGDYKLALTKAIVWAQGRDMEPIVSPAGVAALYRYRPLQAWTIHEDGQKSALLAIQEGE